MFSHPQKLDSQWKPPMSRKEVIGRLLELNKVSTFRFTPAWLNKQWTQRLRSLLLATERPDGPKA